MQRLIWLAGGLSSPAILILLVWFAAFASVAIGPIDYPGQPSAVASGLIAAGTALFLAGFVGGKFVFNTWFARQAEMSASTAVTLNRVVLVTSLMGIVGIGLIAVDRTMLSGVRNIEYSELLRCAPGLVDAIAIKRTPLLYLGYLTFSFGFVSVVLFLLKGEEIKGWAAALAQLSLISPVGYALLYSGRMSILFVLVLIVAAMLVRLSERRPPFPRGHHLLLKLAVAVGVFAVYSNSMWASRQMFCNQMFPLIQELAQEKTERDSRLSGDTAPGRKDIRSYSSSLITASDLNQKVAEARAARAIPSAAMAAEDILAIMLETWNVKPRGYVTSAMQSGYISPPEALIGLSTYFYLSHGVRTVDVVWHARDKISPKWGVYEVGVLSPILRVFFPGSEQVTLMETELRSAGIFGFFPTVWVAAFIDFGIFGAIVYVLIWGFAAGWSAAGHMRSTLITPALLLIFVLASILLSPIQGPLGVANSALVLLSILVTGIALDVMTVGWGSRRKTGKLHLSSTAS
ncbi:MAG: hypothetical protein HY852_05560 [Bradyrhizobium sp.]|uniref:hypothetical protein n=1 Tax=Bradyrhizobium sp. TaxID=376 RepID=UPI0025C51958|nr:hypothetical protein [Bradyrhizobium sp.]MBI5261270.1 hypothetical protein [Bradyrhizobium sp.]